MQHRKHLWSGSIALAIIGALPAAQAADIATRMAKECGACHQMTGPASDSLETRRNRKGPPLFYAGNKFRQDWLANWLQSPARIRPAGDFAPSHIKETPKGEMFDPTNLIEHPALGADAAKQVAAYLMTLKPHDALIARENYTPGNVSERMGTMDFVKFKGCGACHRDMPKYGGISGPELYTAWHRLQPPFIASYIRNPMAWEPRSLMPNKHLNSGAIHKLANYLRVIGKKSGKPK